MAKIKKKFKLVSKYEPAGDQIEAIKQITENLKHDIKDQVLLGATGTGKTFTMANVIRNIGKPTLVLAPNKTLAGQLYGEFKELFPENAVEYFVSYYDYYQPEAYVPSRDLFIEKDSAINEQIDRMRHSATRSLFERDDLIIVSSVSCIYGLGNPDEYKGMMVEVKTNTEIIRDEFLRELVKIQYGRNDIDFHRGTFRVRGDIVDVFPTYEEDRAIRFEFFGDYVDKISWIDPIRGATIAEMDEIIIYPASHYVTSEGRIRSAIETIRTELRDRIKYYKSEIMHLEAQRIEQRTLYDLEIMSEMGFCPGIENYSRHLTGRGEGAPPPTLLEYFPKDFITVIDESHVTVPQVGGMYKGDRARKMNLVQHAFRLPSALDNRPLNFQEFEHITDRTVYVSATPGDFEVKKSEGMIVEQIIRPTGLLDPVIEIRPAKHQVDDILTEVQKRVKLGERVLITTLTKKSSEDLTEYYEGLGVKVKYLHSEIKTAERSEIIRDLRLGVFDVLIGINLLREGLDIPEVTLVAIADADKEGFLRSERSLIQTIGRAARNVKGRVILYADTETKSMKAAIKETNRRREIQDAYNKKHGITPKTIKKGIAKSLIESFGYEVVEGAKGSQLKKLESVIQKYQKNPGGLSSEIVKLRKQMKKSAEALDFEEAAKTRDEIKRLENLQLKMM